MIRVWHYWIVRPKALLIAAHCMLMVAVLSPVVWGSQSHSLSAVLQNNLGLILLLAALPMGFYSSGSASLILTPNLRLFLTKAFGSIAIGLLLLMPLFVAFPNLFPGFGSALSAIVLSALLLFGLRPLLHWLIKRRKFGEGLLVLGSGELARKFYKELVHGKGSETDGLPAAVTFFVTKAGDAADSGVMLNYDELRQVILHNRISRIVVAEANAQNSESLATALLDCKLRGLEVKQVIESYEQLNGKIWLEALRPEWLVYSDGFKPSRYYHHLKRFFDSACALTSLVLSFPVLCLIALLVKLDSKGPILFRQVRVGLHGREFVLLKFRTMRQDAELRTGPVWASDEDQRVTRVGRYLRQYRLDELPQLINVMRSEMSLVGPRPERPYFVELLRQRVPYYALRHYVKPGITGWAQVLYPYGASVEDSYEKLQYDLYYVKHMSLGFDLRILLGTFKVVLFGRGR
ncbi:MAG: TIGR03013 family PEP-CTERM/XrtA system glycosyltransferase [Acidobacteria bacterium]|nr:TIGR03013 family PEP-CTERM/XrtA system glycosyltransferase [Acidobacteriota bacterium]